MSRIRFLKALLAVLALVICTGTMQAAIVTSPSVSSIALTCDLVNGPGPAQTVGIVLSAAGSASVTASVPANSPIVITTATQTVASTTSPVGFQFRVASGCAGVTTSPQSVTITFTPPAANGSPISVTANITITTWLVSSTPTVNLTCDLISGPGAAQPANIKLAGGSSPVSVVATVPANSPLVISSPTQSVSSSSVATAFNLQAPAGCAGISTSPQTVVVTFTAGGGPTITVNAVITVTNWIVAGSPTVLLTCDVVSGPGAAQPVNIKLAGGSSPVSVTVTDPVSSPLVITTATQTVSSSSVATAFNVQAPAACAGITTSPQTVVLTFTAGGSSGPAITVNAVITTTGGYLTVTPSTVAISCNKGGGVVSQSISVTSTQAAGTHFYANPSGWPNWLTPLAGAGSSSASMANATATPVTLTLTPTACASSTAGNYGFNLHIVNSPSADVIVQITLTVGVNNPLTATPAPVSLSYTKAGIGPAVANSVPVTLHNANSPTSVFYTLATGTLPSWLNVDIPSAAFTAATKALSFTATPACAGLANGIYSAAIHFQVSGSVDMVVNVSLVVQNPASSLSFVEGTSKTVNWVMGTALQPITITPISTDQPIQYNVTVAGIVASVTPSFGIAYSFGSPLTITLNPNSINGQAPGSTLTGTVTLNYGTNGTLAYHISLTVLSPGAQLTSIFPTALPVASSGSFNVTLSGSGFVSAPSDLTQQTRVGVVTGGYIISDGNIAVTVVNSSTITLVITVQPGDSLLPFSTSNTVYLGVCNPGGTACSAPTTTNGVAVGQIPLSIGSVPIIQAVTSAASFIQATPPAVPTVAPYDIISIFGTNFCLVTGVGCTGANSILYGSFNPTTLQYLNSLTADQTNYLTVKFLTHGTSTVLGATGAAPLLFANNNQINVLAPAALLAKAGQVVDIVVSYGPANTTNVSAPYPVMIAATDPGVFTIGGDGQGPAAALDSNYGLVTSLNPAGFGATGSSDSITLYVAGLGAPDTDGLVGTAWAGTKCITTAAYYALVAATGTDPLSDDGLVMQSGMYVPNGDGLPPCFKSTDTPGTSNLPIVKIGGVSGIVTYAGWVPDSIAGLYQINVTLPSTTAVASNLPTLVNTANTVVTWANLASASGVQLPVVIQSNSAYSQQAGVYLNVKGRLKITAPAVLTGVTGAAWASGVTTTFTAAGGPASASYTFAPADAATLPTGLALNPDGTVSGTVTATAGTYNVTVNVSDTVSGFTGTLAVTFTITGS